MLPRFVALISLASLVSAQTPHAFLQSAVPALPAAQVTAPAAAQMLTVPAGTAIPLTLINPIKKKSTKPGDAVRATVAFPIMAGMQVAIPAGSYVEGVVQQLNPRASNTGQPEVGIHFTRLVFANGYSVSLDANSTQAEETLPTLGAPGVELASLAPPPIGIGRGSMAMMGQSSPTLPPMPQVGPPKAVIAGAVAGSAALFITVLALGHHAQSKIDSVLFDAGWQFQMVLQSPLTVDASQVAAPASAPLVN
jgi:type IV secretion system protein VirB10